MKTAITDHFDVVIVGAGMVGSTLACSLAKTTLRVGVLEARPPVTAWDADSIDLRVSAVTAASQQIFKGLGAWDEMVAQGVSPFREMHVWDAGGDGAIHFDSADIGEDRLGYIVENRVIQKALFDRMMMQENVEFICPARLTSMDIHSDTADLELEGGRRIKARLVVGADGGNSQVRQLAGIGTQGWSYDQKAIVATVKTTEPHRETAWQRFLPEGPLAFLPLRSGGCSIVWTTSPARADELLGMDEQTFMDELTQAFDTKLGRIMECGPRAAFPLRLQHVNSYVKERLALIGDAAHTIHPLAGQGVNLGLLDAAALSEVLGVAREKGHDIGAFHVLRRYERWRKGDNLLVMAVMDGFKRLFGSSLEPLRTLRNFGLNLTNAAMPVKNQIMLHAMGLKGDLPRLARP